MKPVCYFSLGALVACLATFMSFRAVLDDHASQKAIVTEFVAHYCHPSGSVNESFQLGDAAALSRVAIKSGLQPIAWAEYLKCKAGL